MDEHTHDVVRVEVPRGKHDGSKTPFKMRVAANRKRAKAAKRSRQRNR